MTTPEDEGMRRLFEDAREQSALLALVESAYRADPKRVRQSLLVEYRCPSARGCLLLHAWRTPAGVLYWSPPYKLSATRNEATSTDAGRLANTRDGDRRWKGYAGSVDRLADWGSDAGIPLRCHHVDGSIPAAEVLADAQAAKPGTPTRRRVAPGGSRPVG